MVIFVSFLNLKMFSSNLFRRLRVKQLITGVRKYSSSDENGLFIIYYYNIHPNTLFTTVGEFIQRNQSRLILHCLSALPKRKNTRYTFFLYHSKR